MNYFEIADFNPLNSNFIIPKKFEHIRRYPPEEVLSETALIKFKNLEIPLREVQLFTTPPYTITTIHIDGNTITSKSAINYVVNGPGVMKWYKLKNYNTKFLETSAGTGYMPFDIKDCIETDSLSITKLTLVEVCNPHNIVNNTKSFRYCFSIRYNIESKFDLIKDKLLKWNSL